MQEGPRAIAPPSGARFAQRGSGLLKIFGNGYEPRRCGVHEQHAALVAALQTVELIESPALKRLPAPARLHAHRIVHGDDDRTGVATAQIGKKWTRESCGEQRDDETAEQERQQTPQPVFPRVANGGLGQKTQRWKADDGVRFFPQKVQDDRKPNREGSREKSRKKPVHDLGQKW